MGPMGTMRISSLVPILVKEVQPWLFLSLPKPQLWENEHVGSANAKGPFHDKIVLNIIP